MNSETTRSRIKEAADQVGGVNRLADQAGIKRRTLGNYLSGRNEPKASALTGIAEVSGFSVDYLLGLTDDAGVRLEVKEERTEGEMWDALQRSSRMIADLVDEYGPIPAVWSTTIQELIVRYSLPAEGARRIFQSIRAQKEDGDG